MESSTRLTSPRGLMAEGGERRGRYHFAVPSRPPTALQSKDAADDEVRAALGEMRHDWELVVPKDRKFDPGKSEARALVSC